MDSRQTVLKSASSQPLQSGVIVECISAADLPCGFCPPHRSLKWLLSLSRMSMEWLTRRASQARPKKIHEAMRMLYHSGYTLSGLLSGKERLREQKAELSNTIFLKCSSEESEGSQRVPGPLDEPATKSPKPMVLRVMKQ
ncbi:hypothetical protein EYF80_024295 [Liparis tanakae]|uniref:Uncharacterized protein n=1 Tax=Liparis tanakae TaxID=230148 RepID=A0A4Z2HI74_9TELE|nr:hypothetical protein EYF80_024295 [Liparis tanakae]